MTFEQSLTRILTKLVKDLQLAFREGLVEQKSIHYITEILKKAEGKKR